MGDGVLAHVVAGKGKGRNQHHAAKDERPISRTSRRLLAHSG